MSESAIPLACVPGTIPASARPEHFALLDRLFATEARERRDHPDGFAYRFDVELHAADGDLWVRLRGPDGVHAFLQEELPPIASDAAT